MSGAIGALGTIIQVIGRAFLRRPKLIVKIEEARAAATFPDSISPLIHPILLLRVFIVNKRPQPTMIKDIGLELRRFGRVYQASRIIIEPDDLRKLSPPLTLEDVVGNAMLDHRRGLMGWLRFAVHKMPWHELRARERLVLTAVDTLGKKHRYGRFSFTQIQANFLRSIT
jgi:hypothetical protein